MGMEGFGNFDGAFGGFSQFSFEDKGQVFSQAKASHIESHSEGLKAIERQSGMDIEYSVYSEIPFNQGYSNSYPEVIPYQHESKDSPVKVEEEIQKEETLPPSLAATIKEPKSFQVPFKESSISTRINAQNSSVLSKVPETDPSSNKDKQSPEIGKLGNYDYVNKASGRRSEAPNPEITNSLVKSNNEFITLPQSRVQFPQDHNENKGRNHLIMPSIGSSIQSLPQGSGFSLQISTKKPSIDPRLISPKKDQQPAPLISLQRQNTKTPFIGFSCPTVMKPIDMTNKVAPSVESFKQGNNSNIQVSTEMKASDLSKPPDQPSTVPSIKPQIRLGGVNLFNKTPGPNFSFGNLGFSCKIDEQKKIVKLNDESCRKVPNPQIQLQSSNFQFENSKNVNSLCPKIDNPKTTSMNSSLEQVNSMINKAPGIALIGASRNFRPNEHVSMASLSKTNVETCKLTLPDRGFPSETRPQKNHYQVFSAPITEEINISYKQMKAGVVNVQENLVKCAYLVKRISSLKSYLASKFRDTERELNNLGVRQ